MTTALAFSYNGTHFKNVVGAIDPVRHLQMLLAAIDYHNPDGAHDIIVSAIHFDPWTMASEHERLLALEVYRRARVVVNHPHPQDHQFGACWCLRMATEAAAAVGAMTLVMLAEDLLLNRPVAEIVAELGDADYIGSTWMDDYSCNSQVFACRVNAFANLQTRQFVFDPRAMDVVVENHLFNRLAHFGLKRIRRDDYAVNTLYFHTHDPEAYLAECRRRGVRIVPFPACDDPATRAVYERNCSNPTDIYQHLPYLHGLARQVRTVTELGTRTAISTSAFLAANPERFVAYDLRITPEARQLADLSLGTLTLYEADSRHVDIEPVDLLFIDTWHTYEQLKAELNRHAERVQRWIVLHDTTTFGEQGEDGGPGLWPAVTEFLSSHPEWTIERRVHFCHGLTTLRRSVNGPRGEG